MIADLNPEISVLYVSVPRQIACFRRPRQFRTRHAVGRSRAESRKQRVPENLGGLQELGDRRIQCGRAHGLS